VLAVTSREIESQSTACASDTAAVGPLRHDRPFSDVKFSLDMGRCQGFLFMAEAYQDIQDQRADCSRIFLAALGRRQRELGPQPLSVYWFDQLP
jgi:hypothetical protein